MSPMEICSRMLMAPILKCKSPLMGQCPQKWQQRPDNPTFLICPEIRQILYPVLWISRAFRIFPPIWVGCLWLAWVKSLPENPGIWLVFSLTPESKMVLFMTL